MKTWNKFQMVGDFGGPRGIKACCKLEDNLELTILRDDLIVNVCQVCNCRHFEVTLDPGKLGLLGSSL